MPRWTDVVGSSPEDGTKEEESGESGSAQGLSRFVFWLLVLIKPPGPAKSQGSEKGNENCGNQRETAPAFEDHGGVCRGGPADPSGSSHISSFLEGLFPPGGGIFAFFPLFLLSRRQEDDGGDDAQGADPLGEPEGNFQPENGRHRGGQGFRAGQQAGFGGTNVAKTLQIKKKRDQGAEQDDKQDKKGIKGRPGSAGGPRGMDEGKSDTPDHHSPTDHRGGTPPLQQSHGIQRVKGQGGGGSQSPKEGRPRDGQTVRASAGHQQKGADERQQDGRGFLGPGPSTLGKGQPDGDQRGAQILQQGGRGGVAGGDGGEVGVLNGQHAQDGEQQKAQPIACVPPDPLNGLVLSQQVNPDQEQGTGKDQAHRHHPSGGKAFVLKQVLGDGAGQSPTDGSGEDHGKSIQPA